MSERIKTGADDVDAAIIEKTVKAKQELLDGKIVVSFYDSSDPDAKPFHTIKWTPQNDTEYIRPYSVQGAEVSKTPDEGDEKVIDTEESADDAPTGLYGTSAEDVSAAQRDHDAEAANASAAPDATTPDSDEDQKFKAAKAALEQRISETAHFDTDTRTRYMKLAVDSATMKDVTSLQGVMDQIDEIHKPKVSNPTASSDLPQAPAGATSQAQVQKRKISLSLSGRPDATSRDRDDDEEDEPKQQKGAKKKKGMPDAAPTVPPIDWTPSDRTESNVESPFRNGRIRPESLRTDPGISDAYVPAFVSREFGNTETHINLQQKQSVAPPTMIAIESDPVLKDSFALMLEAKGPLGLEIYDRYRRSSEDPTAMRPQDLADLQKLRLEFQNRRILLEELTSHIKQADIDFFLKSNPEGFSFITQYLEPERVAEIVRIHMDKVLMRMSEAQLTRVMRASRANHDIRRSDYYREMYANIEAKIASGVSLEALREKGNRENTLDFLKPNFISRLRGNVSAEESLQALELIDKNNENILEVLAATISTDSELKRQVANEALHGISVPRVGERGTDSSRYYSDEVAIEQLEGESKIQDTDTLRRRIREEDFQKEVENEMGKTWEEMHPEEREIGSYQVLQNEGRLPKPPRGLFGIMLASIWSMAFPRMQKDLLNEFDDKK